MRNANFWCGFALLGTVIGLAFNMKSNIPQGANMSLDEVARSSWGLIFICGLAVYVVIGTVIYAVLSMIKRVGKFFPFTLLVALLASHIWSFSLSSEKSELLYQLFPVHSFFLQFLLNAVLISLLILALFIPRRTQPHVD